MSPGIEIAVLGGGCFWCTEAVYQQIRGVVSVTPGYAGGVRPHPTYEQVCSGATGHAEVVRIEFDSETISFREILEVFFATHDPTTLNRQGYDVGTQYRSILLYTNDAQRREAEQVIREIGPGFPEPIVTEVRPLDAFYEAEPYHHQYYRRNPSQPYCLVTIEPKLETLRKKLRRFLKAG